VTNVPWENFRSKANLYGINLDQYWQETFTPDYGAAALSNITFRNFTQVRVIIIQSSVIDVLGGIANAQRPPLCLIASDFIPAVNINADEVSIWAELGTEVVNKINNIYGTGEGEYVYGSNDGLKTLAPGATPTTYTSAYTITAALTGWTDPPFPAWAAPSTVYGSDYDHSLCFFRLTGD
jgi:rhamnogalacturonan hydrolase